jgi:CHAT domain-containing protein
MALAKAAARGGGPRADQVRKVQDIKAQIQALDAELQKLEEDWLAKIAQDPVYSELEKKYRQALPSSDAVAGEMQQNLANGHKAEELSEKYAQLLEQCGYTPECAEKYKGMQQEIEALVGQNGSSATLSVDLAQSERVKAEMDAREKQIDGYAARPKAREALYERKGRLQGVLAKEESVLAGMKETLRAVEDPKPITIADVQASLSANEALLYYLIGKDETFIWAVTKSDTRWVRAELGGRPLEREVTALRCGLDFDGTWLAPGAHCADLLKMNFTEADYNAGKPLPFDRGRAFALYKAMLGQVADMIGGKSLLIVPSGPLARLPFQVLVTEAPGPAAAGDSEIRHTKWLVRDHALTVLPSVSSLKALRQVARPSGAVRPMVGFGNPLLTGSEPGDAKAAGAAIAKAQCPSAAAQQIAANIAERRGVRAFDLHGGLASVEEIRSQVPLPETADELCAVAQGLGVGPEDIHLGTHATEGEIKRLSEAGELASFHVVHFATHGALAGQVTGSAEPGLLLTPPGTATPRDDGYLTASEIAALKLDADWVILSACNTSAGGTEGGEELSGIAQAFFYAGARALLVSHWAVYSEATVKLITKALAAMAADKSIGRTEAMRQSMLALMDTGTSGEAHPAFWAPFVLVGEGGAAR